MSAEVKSEELTVGNENENEAEVEVVDEEFLMAEKLHKLVVDDLKGEEQDLDLPGSETASLSPSLYEHVQENGRTYHKYRDGKYMLPNDEREQNRLDFQHYLCILTLHGRLHLAPLKKSTLKHVLDFGTGTGIWAIDFAKQYPDAQVIGSDLSPIQPEFIPANLSFEVDDMDDTWIYSHPFSYIHGRLMVLCFTDPISVFQKVYDNLEPGGYFEMQDTAAPLMSIDNTIEGTAMQRCWDLIAKAGRTKGIDIEIPRKYKSFMQQVGFVDVKEVVTEWPLGHWAKSAHHKRIGAWLVKDTALGFKGMVMRLFTKVLGMTEAEVDKIEKDVLADMNNRDIHAYQPFYVVYGRKPRVGEKVVVKKETTVPVSSELASKENPSPPVTKPEKDKETTIQQPITDTSIPIVGDEPIIIEKPLDNNDENPVETKPTAEKTVAEEKDPLKGLTTEEKWAYITKELLFLRYKLQKGLLTKDIPIDPEKMPEISNFLSKLEDRRDLIEEVIRTTQIHKVMRVILNLEELPRDEEFGIKKRCVVLLDGWQDVLGEGEGEKERDTEATGVEAKEEEVEKKV